MRLVVDASVAVKWFVPERPDEQNLAEAFEVARYITSEHAELFAPPHWIGEILSVLARVAPAAIDDALSVLYRLRCQTVATIEIHKNAADLAITLNHHLFDTLYHAVALEYDATLVTADDRYFAKAQGQGRIVMLKDFAAPA